MGDDTSNDMETIEIDDNPEKPLISLFKRLLKNSHKQNTVLTNSQIVEILQEEFHIQASQLHDLELDIYLNVLKRFLRDWPQWDDFDRIVKRTKDSEKVERIIQVHYEKLKDYLKAMLDITEPIAKDKIAQLEISLDKPGKRNKKTNKDPEDVVMEVSCTRAQLNQLVYKHPLPGKDTVFNIDPAVPSRISLTTPTFESLLNCGCFAININLTSLLFKREMGHVLSHMLVNKKLNIQSENVELDSCFQEKTTTKTKDVSKKDIMDLMNKLVAAFSKTPYKNLIEMFFDTIKKDLAEAPETLKVPGMYRRYCNKYPYVRYLYTDVNAPDSIEAKKYDLRLEETINPMYNFNIGRIELLHMPIIVNLPREYSDKIFVECKMCNIKFQGKLIDMYPEMHQHFLECHQNEPDWQCTHCHSSFPMLYLASKRWFHECNSSTVVAQ